MRNGKQETIHGVCRSATLTGRWRRGIGTVCLALAATVVLPAQDAQPSPNAVKFKSLVSFDGTNGGNPINTLVQGMDANLYGTTPLVGAFGSASGGGTVFKMTAGGSMTVLYNFCALPNCADGSVPTGLTLGTDGNFYGTTFYNGANFGGAGTFFKITPGGTLTTLYNFCSLTNCTDGLLPEGMGAQLVLGTDDHFYGVTEGGGANASGTVFKITPTGALTTLYDFCSLPKLRGWQHPSFFARSSNRRELLWNDGEWRGQRPGYSL